MPAVFIVHLLKNPAANSGTISSLSPFVGKMREFSGKSCFFNKLVLPSASVVCFSHIRVRSVSSRSLFQNRFADGDSPNVNDGLTV